MSKQIEQVKQNPWAGNTTLV